MKKKGVGPVQVWSQEAFCHCMDQKALMKEVSRVLKPGGVIVFSDIMQGDGGGDCTSFTGQNVVASMASPQMYKVRTTKPVLLRCSLIHKKSGKGSCHRLNASPLEGSVPGTSCSNR
ncbi:MAG: class I SAM-dependent methyltransferase [Akkermansiaceae bacterium]|nr:class I SAM-dependent methyltransferase [Akkermansiaceae bacterium]